MFGRKERKTPFVREPLVSLEDLRDDCVSLFRDSGLTMKQVHEQGGPTPQTVSKWLYGETKFPRLDSMRALFQAVGGAMVIVGPAMAASLRKTSLTARLGLTMPQPTKMNQKAHKARQAATRRGAQTRAKAHA
jgi:hypothetical protein